MPLLNPDLATSKAELSLASEGMRHPTVTTLHAGMTLYRFASSTRPGKGKPIPASEWAKGPWWLQEHDYRTIVSRQKSGSLNLGVVARAAAAVQPSWSGMDILIEGKLRDDINVYIGKGKTQYRDLLPNGMYMTLTGWPDVDQIYIPNLRTTASAAFGLIRSAPISSHSFGF